MLKIVLAGSVSSSFITLKKLVEHRLDVVAVFGYEPGNEAIVSGYVNMHDYCVTHKIPYYPFIKISSDSIKVLLNSIKPDLFFVVGLSQLIPWDILNISKLGNIGFHPTFLPKGRGRAPIAWLILEEKYGAANFFLMGAGVDDGPIFVQHPFKVEDSDQASTVEKKILIAIENALDEWLPKLKEGIWNPIPQEEKSATYYAKRAPDDGWVNWATDAMSIDKLIKASSRPHPGAYSFLLNEKIIIYQSILEDRLKIKGVIGRVLMEDNDSYLIQAGNGLVWISELFDINGNPVKLKIGQKLGYYTELELYNLNLEIKKIKENLGI